MFGGIDWNALLGRKYAIMGQQADADTKRADAGLISANADANLSNVRAGLLPKSTAADIAATNAQTDLTKVNTTLAPELAKASEAASYGNAFANRAQGRLYGTQADAEGQSSSVVGRALGGDLSVLKALQALRGLGLTTGQ